MDVKALSRTSFSIGQSNLWAFDCIAEAGYRYSSSVYPIRHDHYGMPDAPRFPYRPRANLLEIPLTTMRVSGINLPAAGGGYFRLLPYAISQALLRRVNKIDSKPAVFYLHPWELDPGQPRIPGTSLKTRFRHYVNLHRTAPRLRSLLADFRWGRMDQLFLDVAQ
jgi:polysaccharide deacetylase family protein (PEP-CTERM system associated)